MTGNRKQRRANLLANRKPDAMSVEPLPPESDDIRAIIESLEPMYSTPHVENCQIVTNDVIYQCIAGITGKPLKLVSQVIQAQVSPQHLDSVRSAFMEDADLAQVVNAARLTQRAYDLGGVAAATAAIDAVQSVTPSDDPQPPHPLNELFAATTNARAAKLVHQLIPERSHSGKMLYQKVPKQLKMVMTEPDYTPGVISLDESLNPEQIRRIQATKSQRTRQVVQLTVPSYDQPQLSIVSEPLPRFDDTTPYIHPEHTPAQAAANREHASLQFNCPVPGSYTGVCTEKWSDILVPQCSGLLTGLVRPPGDIARAPSKKIFRDAADAIQIPLNYGGHTPLPFVYIKDISRYLYVETEYDGLCLPYAVAVDIIANYQKCLHTLDVYRLAYSIIFASDTIEFNYACMSLNQLARSHCHIAPNKPISIHDYLGYFSITCGQLDDASATYTGVAVTASGTGYHAVYCTDNGNLLDQLSASYGKPRVPYPMLCSQVALRELDATFTLPSDVSPPLPYSHDNAGAMVGFTELFHHLFAIYKRKPTLAPTLLRTSQFSILFPIEQVTQTCSYFKIELSSNHWICTFVNKNPPLLAASSQPAQPPQVPKEKAPLHGFADPEELTAGLPGASYFDHATMQHVPTMLEALHPSVHQWVLSLNKDVRDLAIARFTKDGVYKQPPARYNGNPHVNIRSIINHLAYYGDALILQRHILHQATDPNFTTVVHRIAPMYDRQAKWLRQAPPGYSEVWWRPDIFEFDVNYNNKHSSKPYPYATVVKRKYVYDQSHQFVVACEVNYYPEVQEQLQRAISAGATVYTTNHSYPVTSGTYHVTFGRASEAVAVVYEDVDRSMRVNYIVSGNEKPYDTPLPPRLYGQAGTHTISGLQVGYRKIQQYWVSDVVSCELVEWTQTCHPSQRQTFIFSESSDLFYRQASLYELLNQKPLSREQLDAIERYTLVAKNQYLTRLIAEGDHSTTVACATFCAAIRVGNSLAIKPSQYPLIRHHCCEHMVQYGTLPTDKQYVVVNQAVHAEGFYDTVNRFATSQRAHIEHRVHQASKPCRQLSNHFICLLLSWYLLVMLVPLYYSLTFASGVLAYSTFNFYLWVYTDHLDHHAASIIRRIVSYPEPTSVVRGKYLRPYHYLYAVIVAWLLSYRCINLMVHLKSSVRGRGKSYIFWWLWVVICVCLMSLVYSYSNQQEDPICEDIHMYASSFTKYSNITTYSNVTIPTNTTTCLNTSVYSNTTMFSNTTIYSNVTTCSVISLPSPRILLDGLEDIYNQTHITNLTNSTQFADAILSTDRDVILTYAMPSLNKTMNNTMEWRNTTLAALRKSCCSSKNQNDFNWFYSNLNETKCEYNARNMSMNFDSVCSTSGTKAWIRNTFLKFVHAFHEFLCRPIFIIPMRFLTFLQTVVMGVWEVLQAPSKLLGFGHIFLGHLSSFWSALVDGFYFIFQYDVAYEPMLDNVFRSKALVFFNRVIEGIVRTQVFFAKLVLGWICYFAGGDVVNAFQIVDRIHAIVSSHTLSRGASHLVVDSIDLIYRAIYTFVQGLFPDQGGLLLSGSTITATFIQVYFYGTVFMAGISVWLARGNVQKLVFNLLCCLFTIIRLLQELDFFTAHKTVNSAYLRVLLLNPFYCIVKFFLHIALSVNGPFVSYFYPFISVGLAMLFGNSTVNYAAIFFNASAVSFLSTTNAHGALKQVVYLVGKPNKLQSLIRNVLTRPQKAGKKSTLTRAQRSVIKTTKRVAIDQKKFDAVTSNPLYNLREHIDQVEFDACMRPDAPLENKLVKDMLLIDVFDPDIQKKIHTTVSQVVEIGLYLSQFKTQIRGVFETGYELLGNLASYYAQSTPIDTVQAILSRQLGSQTDVESDAILKLRKFTTVFNQQLQLQFSRWEPLSQVDFLKRIAGPSRRQVKIGFDKLNVGAIPNPMAGFFAKKVERVYAGQVKPAPPKTVKPRCITAFKHTFKAMRMHVQANLSDLMKQTDIFKQHSAIGMTGDGLRQWVNIARSKYVRPVFIWYDHSKFDSTQHTKLRRAVDIPIQYRFFRQMAAILGYHPDQITVLERFFLNDILKFEYSLPVPGLKSVPATNINIVSGQVVGTQPSGCATTGIMNTARHIAYQYSYIDESNCQCDHLSASDDGLLVAEYDDKQAICNALFKFYSLQCNNKQGFGLTVEDFKWSETEADFLSMRVVVQGIDSVVSKFPRRFICYGSSYQPNPLLPHAEYLRAIALAKAAVAPQDSAYDYLHSDAVQVMPEYQMPASTNEDFGFGIHAPARACLQHNNPNALLLVQDENIIQPALLKPTVFLPILSTTIQDRHFAQDQHCFVRGMLPADFQLILQKLDKLAGKSVEQQQALKNKQKAKRDKNNQKISEQIKNAHARAVEVLHTDDPSYTAVKGATDTQLIKLISELEHNPTYKLQLAVGAKMANTLDNTFASASVEQKRKILATILADDWTPFLKRVATAALPVIWHHVKQSNIGKRALQVMKEYMGIDLNDSPQDQTHQLAQLSHLNWVDQSTDYQNRTLRFDGVSTQAVCSVLFPQFTMSRIPGSNPARAILVNKTQVVTLSTNPAGNALFVLFPQNVSSTGWFYTKSAADLVITTGAGTATLTSGPIISTTLGVTQYRVTATSIVLQSIVSSNNNGGQLLIAMGQGATAAYAPLAFGTDGYRDCDYFLQTSINACSNHRLTYYNSSDSNFLYQDSGDSVDQDFIAITVAGAQASAAVLQLAVTYQIEVVATGNVLYSLQGPPPGPQTSQLLATAIGQNKDLLVYGQQEAVQLYHMLLATDPTFDAVLSVLLSQTTIRYTHQRAGVQHFGFEPEVASSVSSAVMLGGGELRASEPA